MTQLSAEAVRELENNRNNLTKACSNIHNIETKQKQPTHIDSNNTKYSKKESYKLIGLYGSEIYFYSLSLEDSLHPDENFLKRHKISPFIRSKMVDWMLEVFDAYQSDAQTFFVCVNIMDTYISQCQKSLKDSSIHLLGIVCMFIASKFEDSYPIQLKHAEEKIGHGKFSQKMIKDKEKEILNTLKFNIVTATTYDFITIYFYDFYSNNGTDIENMQLGRHLEILSNTAIFFAKLMCISEMFSPIPSSTKAVACVIAAFDLMRMNSKNLTEEMEEYLNQWISFLNEKGRDYNNSIPEVYNKLVLFYQNLEKFSYIPVHLKSTHELYFS